MKLTKSKLKQVIREEIQKMNEAKTYADAMAGTNIDVSSKGIDVSSKGITSLEGAPQKVEGSVYCDNNSLTSLKGAPQKVKGDFYCYNNSLTSLEGAPKEVEGDFYCQKNKTKFTEEDVRAVCKVGGRILV